MRLRYRPPITCIEVKSHKPNDVEISWHDEDVEDVTYTIYWSNKPGIRIDNDKTYLGSEVVKLTKEERDIKRKKLKNDNPFEDAYGQFQQRENNMSVHLEIPAYEWIYVVITKEDYRSKEIEVNVIRDRTFTCKNFDVRLLNRGNAYDYITIELDVLEDADTYKIYHNTSLDITSPNDIISESFNVKGFNRVTVKIPRYDNAMVYIAKVVDGKEYDKEFLLYNETSENGKFVHLCGN